MERCGLPTALTAIQRPRLRPEESVTVPAAGGFEPFIGNHLWEVAGITLPE